jgi:hypothetical protein
MAAREIPRISAPLRGPLEFGRFRGVRHPLNDAVGGREQQGRSDGIPKMSTTRSACINTLDQAINKKKTEKK